MTGKYDRSIEDIERARMEEGRFWSQRFPEPGLSPYGVVAGSYGYSEPISGIQPRTFTPPNYPNVPVSGFVQPQSLGFAQGFTGPFPAAPGQPMQHPINPALAPVGQNVYWFSHPQFGMNPLMNPYAQFPTPFWNPYQTSRAFGHPPRGYKRSDELIKDEICKRLTLMPEIDASDVEVMIKDGEVTLRGTIDDRFAKRLIEDIAETTFGVRDVLNEVRIGTRVQEHELSGVSKGKEK